MRTLVSILPSLSNSILFGILIKNQIAKFSATWPPDYSVINQYSFYVQLFCSTILGTLGLKFMGEFCCMLIKLCGFGQRKPNNIIDSQIPQGSDGSNETRQNIQEPDVGPLINYVSHYSVIFFSSALL